MLGARFSCVLGGGNGDAARCSGTLYVGATEGTVAGPSRFGSTLLPQRPSCGVPAVVLGLRTRIVFLRNTQSILRVQQGAPCYLLLCGAPCLWQLRFVFTEIWCRPGKAVGTSAFEVKADGDVILRSKTFAVIAVG